MQAVVDVLDICEMHAGSCRCVRYNVKYMQAVVDVLDICEMHAGSGRCVRYM